MMKLNLACLALVLTTAALVPAQADTTYNLAFSDTSSAPVFTDGSGTFTVNGSGRVTDVDATFEVATAFYFYGQYNVGDSFTINTLTNASTSPANDLPYYDAANGMFSSSITIYENYTAGETGIRLFVGESGTYDVDALGEGEFYGQYGDGGTYGASITTPPAVAPEPSTLGLISLVLCVSGAELFRRRRSQAGS